MTNPYVQPVPGAHLIPAPMPEVGRDPEVEAAEAARLKEPKAPRERGEYGAGEIHPDDAIARDRAIHGAAVDAETEARARAERDAEIDRRIKAVTGPAE